MLNEDISKALGDISDDLLLNAMEIPERKKRRRVSLTVSLAAACLLLLPLLLASLFQPKPQPVQTGPGVITVLAHGLDAVGNPTQQTDVLKEGEIFQSEKQKDSGNGQTFLLSFRVDASQYPGMELRMRVYASAGIFRKPPKDEQVDQELPELERLLRRYYGQEYEVEVGQSVYWQTDGFDYLYMEQQIEKGNYDFASAYRDHDFEKGPAYIHVLLRADGNLVGFCRIRITLADETVHKSDRQFCFQVVASVSFPQVDGRWQDVSEAQLRELLLRDVEGLQQEQG